MVYNNKVLDAIVSDFFDSNVIGKDDTIIVALSGGMDSMCLLDSLYKLQSDFSYILKALHIHHGIRGEEADKDLNFVSKYCKSIGVPIEIRKVKAKEFAKKHNYTLEEAARILRYKIFDEVYNSSRNKSKVFVAVAHHMKDQVETIIHNMIRGTGLRGLAGMKKVSSYIIRPLLYIEKETISDYIKEFGIPYVTDLTNEDINYTRNYIRKEIIPRFNTLNEKSLEHILELSKIAREIDDYLNLLADYLLGNMTLSKKNDEIIIDLTLFKNTSDIIKKEIVRKIISSLVSTLKDVTSVNVSDVITLASKEKGGHLDLPYNITVDKKSKDLIFKRNKKNISMSKRRIK